MNPSPRISVCVPVYNAAPYLGECIDSILTQTYTDFELLLADDGSTDGSAEIAASYSDPRIRLIRGPHDYVGTLNRLLDEARGEFIARMDADDVMLPYRLEAQVGYMEKHAEVGVLGGGFLQFGESQGKFIPLHKVSMQDMIDSCCIAHPTVMIRSSVLQQHGFRYENDFMYAEDYRLWIQMLKCEVVFRNLTTPVIRYRLSGNQTTSQHEAEQATRAKIAKKDGARWLVEKSDGVLQEYVRIPQTDNLLTVVIPFLNEKEEVGITVRQIRNTVGNNVDIIVINDHSDDNYDYPADLAKLNVTYIYNEYRIGAAASKEKGARLSRTPFFILMDAHMRCYTPNWHRLVIEELQKNDNQILCCQAKALGKNSKQLVYEKNVTTTYAAFMLFDYHYYIPVIQWVEGTELWKLPNRKIACVLGACYAASKRYWNYLRGMEGLMHYGCEEPYISLKAWMEGGGCKMLTNVVFGHIYRDAPPYRIVNAQMQYNNLAIANTLFPTSLRCWANAVAYKISPSVYEKIQFWLSVNKSLLTQLKRYYAQTFHGDFEMILKQNDNIDLEKHLMAKHEEKRIPSLLDFLKENAETPNLDLWEGSMGLLIALCIYLEYAQTEKQFPLAIELMERITSQITPQAEFPVTFSRGICGIGWGLIYMTRNRLVDNDFEKELSVIDKMVMERDPRRINDFTFQTGIGGILCYVTHRLFCLQNKGAEIPFDSRYLSELRATAEKALKNSGDFRTHSYALLFLEYGKEDWTVLTPKWKDVVDLPTFLPENRNHWKKGLTGATGYFCNLIQILQCTRPIPA